MLLAAPATIFAASGGARHQRLLGGDDFAAVLKRAGQAVTLRG